MQFQYEELYEVGGPGRTSRETSEYVC